jgi:hypothetical protein
VGPVKYISALIYGEDESKLESAVRAVIVMFVFVFDPMAILLLMGANYSFMNRKKTVPPKPVPENPTKLATSNKAKTVEKPEPNIIDIDAPSFDVLPKNSAPASIIPETELELELEPDPVVVKDTKDTQEENKADPTFRYLFKRQGRYVKVLNKHD